MLIALTELIIDRAKLIVLNNEVSMSSPSNNTPSSCANWLRRMNANDEQFQKKIKDLLKWDSETDEQIHSTVSKILADVKRRGDEALLEYSNQFDNLAASSIKSLEVSQARLTKALNAIPGEQRNALEHAAMRIRGFHDQQKQSSWFYTEENGNKLGQKITPLDRVGVYVPGGKAAYPSSVLMNIIPAKVAEVQEIIMVVPTPNAKVNDLVLAAAAIAGVDRVFTIGGAQAVAALAYGTETIPAVDKIVGPGNIYVATAKKLVFGTVGIDMIAGPSEILVVCDGGTDPRWIAMDLFSQAEHDENAQAILVSPDAGFLDKVQSAIDELLPQQPRQKIIEQSLRNRGVLIQVDDLDQAVSIVNAIAPEHLELSVEDPDALLPYIRHAGAIFMGRYTVEALGDYCAGPNHVLPTSGTARFASPLGIYDFQKRTSIIHCSAEGASSLGKVASVLARGEGLDAHAASAEYRIKD